MATEIIRTVKPSGGDYTSLSNWEAGEQGDLPTLDEIHTAECYSMEDTAGVYFNGWETDPTRYIKIYTPTSERHDGKWNTSKYRLVPSTYYGLYIEEEFVEVDGLQIQLSASSGDGFYGVRFSNVGASNKLQVSNCILKGVFSGTASNGSGLYILDADAIVEAWNNIFYDFINGTNTFNGIRVGSASTVDLFNNTVHNSYYGYRRDAGTVNATNCGATSCPNPFAGTISQTTCSSATPTFEDEGGDDFHLQAGDTTWRNQGTTDPGSGLYSDDIDGETRSGTWDIGADEWVSTGVLKVIAETYQFSESTLRFGTSARVTNETYQLSEGLIRKGASTRLISETLNWGESLIRKLASTRIVAETIQFEEGLIRKLASLRLISETVQLSENVLKWMGIFKLVNEVTQWGEGILRRSGFVKLIDETVTFGEGLIRRLASLRLISETVQWGESLLRKLASIRLVSETIQFGEGIVRRLASIRLVSETVNWAESNIKSLVAQVLDLFKPQLKSLKQRYQLKSLKQKHQFKSLKQRYQLKWLG